MNRFVSSFKKKWVIEHSSYSLIDKELVPKLHSRGVSKMVVRILTCSLWRFLIRQTSMMKAICKDKVVALRQVKCRVSVRETLLTKAVHSMDSVDSSLFIRCNNNNSQRHRLCCVQYRQCNSIKVDHVSQLQHRRL